MGGASCRLGHPAHLALHPPLPSHGLIPVQAARDRSRPMAHPSPPPSLRSVVTSVPTARPHSPSPSPLPHRRRRPLTTQRNGSAHPPLPKSACLSASCRANAPTRPDRRVRTCSLGSASIPAPGATRSCRARSTSPPLDLAGSAAGARTPGRSSRPARLEPPPPGKDSVPTARPRCQPPDPIHHRAHRTAVGQTTLPMTGRPMDCSRSVRSIPAGRSDLACPSPAPDRRRRGDPTGWPADRAGGGVALPARLATAGGRTVREVCLGLPFSRRGGVPSRSAPVPAAVAGVGAIGKLELVERRVGGSCLARPLRLVFPSVALPHPARAATSVTTARYRSPVRR